MQEKYNGQEKRKFTRLDANFVVNYRVEKDGFSNYDLSQTKNVSQGGVLVTTNRKFEKGTVLSVTVRFPFVSKRIKLLGEVVDSHEVARDLIYDTRIRFINMDEDFFAKLGEFIDLRLR